MRYPILLAIVVLSSAVTAQQRDPSGYEPVLLPILGPRMGAFGSSWVTEFVGRNVGAAQAHVFNSECGFFCECAVVVCIPGGGPQAREPFALSDPNPDPYRANPGLMLYFGRTTAHNIATQLRVRDISRSTTSYGTEVPVVREAEMYTTTIHLLDIPVRDGFREHVRVYGIGPMSSVFDVRVLILDEASDTVVLDMPMRLRRGPYENPQEKDEFPLHPAYGDIVDLSEVAAAFGSDKIRISIIPQSPGRFWSFVAITNNETQHVTLVTPQ